MPQVDLNEERLLEVVVEAVGRMRLPIDNNDQKVLAREIYSRYIPNNEEFRPGDKIIWHHGYKDHAPCQGRVVAFPQGSVRVEIEVVSTLWYDEGQTARHNVFPTQLEILAEEVAEEKSGREGK